MASSRRTRQRPKNEVAVAAEEYPQLTKGPRLKRAQLEQKLENVLAVMKAREEQADGYENDCEAFLEGDRIALEVLGELIPKVTDVTIRSRLGVVEDILEGACARFTD